ncbi:unnamed protein product [Brassica oleracea var. botrytis]|uniref:(rape) hypothetical protein n=1 Tax=Brassica napus TaxID=3708 RepID=A0A816I0A6_BRANA|nr:unnamed protein product [Brassica napus]
MAGRHRISSPLFLFAAPDLLCCDMSPLVPHKRIASNLQMQRMSWPPLMTLLIPPDPPDPPNPPDLLRALHFPTTDSLFICNQSSVCLHRRGLLSSYLAAVLPPPNSSQFSFSISAVSSSLNTINLLMSFASYCGVVLTSDILISSNAMKLSGGLIIRRGRPVSISDPCALQQLFTFGFWTTTASPTGRGELDPSALSGEQTENGGSKSRHFRPFDYGSRVFQLLPANVRLSKLFEIHIVSSGSSVGASTEKGQFAPPLPRALTPTPKYCARKLDRPKTLCLSPDVCSNTLKQNECDDYMLRSILVTSYWRQHSNVEVQDFDPIKPFNPSSNSIVLNVRMKAKLVFEIHLLSLISFVEFRTDRACFIFKSSQIWLHFLGVAYGFRASHQKLLLVNSPSASYWCFNVVFDYQLFCRTIALEIKVKFLHGVLHLVELDSPLIRYIFPCLVMLYIIVVPFEHAPGSSVSVVNFYAH